MKKEYIIPQSELVKFVLETNFLDSGSAEGLGTDLGNPFDMSDIDFTTIFG